MSSMSRPLRISLSPDKYSSSSVGSISIVTDFQAAASYDSYISPLTSIIGMSSSERKSVSSKLVSSLVPAKNTELVVNRTTTKSILAVFLF